MSLFEVSINGDPPRLVSARSRGAARYDRYLAASDVWSISFHDFLKITTVRRAQVAPPPPRHPAMTDDMRELARHALGLPNSMFRSYRNRFVTGDGKHGEAWAAMVAAGLAGKREAKTLPFGGADLYWLTREGALSALEPSEKLCPEDFPHV